jgi:hypothetical protein
MKVSWGGYWHVLKQWRWDCIIWFLFFFDAVPAEIESIKVIDNSQYLGLKVFDENNNERDIRIDNRGVIKNSHQHIWTGAWFPY